MNLKDLKNKFDSCKVPERLYSIDGTLKEDSNCIQQTTKGWEVFYVERGEKKLVVEFEYEFQATDYLWGIILNTLEQDYGAEIIINYKTNMIK